MLRDTIQIGLMKQNNKEKNMKNTSKLLKIAGIVMIPAGLLALVLGAADLSGIKDLADLAAYVGVDTNLLETAFLIYILGALCSVATGIIGVMFSKKPEKATFCLIDAGGTSLICAIATILSISGGFVDGVRIVVGMVIPIAFLAVAVMNKLNVSKKAKN